MTSCRISLCSLGEEFMQESGIAGQSKKSNLGAASSQNI